MDNQRVFTWGLVGLMFLIAWNAWQADYRPVPAATPVAAGESLPGDTPPASPVDESELPELPSQSATQSLPQAESTTTQSESTNLIQVTTDVLSLSIDPVGGDIVSARILKYPVSKDTPDTVIQLLSRQPSEFSVYRTGLRAGTAEAEPNHLAKYRATASTYTLPTQAEELTIPLTWKREDGLSVVKTYLLRRGSYQIDIDYTVNNGSTEAWTAANYAQIVRVARAPDRSMFDVDSYSFSGPVAFNGSKFERYAIDDLASEPPAPFEATNGWIAGIQHHFLVAAIPPAGDSWKYTIGSKNGRFTAGAIGAMQTTAAGETNTYAMTLFVGPKLQAQLAEIAPKLKLTVDYGILTPLAQPLFWLLSKVHDIVMNWGWAIIIVTLLIKLVFYRLTAASGRSMAKMRKLQPRLKQIQERYKDDRQKLSQAMMDLYKREKVNPAAGCLPILVQMPFFLAFYWALLESVEMRQAPFMLWINDLSSRDPFFVLPLLMGAAMFFQQKLNPAPPDPIQAKVMSFLPVIFTVFFAFFPAGLVLYWLTNTLLSIAQQWRINQVVEAEDRKAKPA